MMRLTSDRTDDGHWGILSLRLAGIVTSLSVIISLAWAANARSSAVGNVDVGSAFDFMVVGASAYTFLLSAVTLSTRVYLHRPVHPGVYIGLDLVAFVILLTMLTLFWTALQPFDKAAYMCYQEACDADTVRNVELFGGIMAIINCTIHLASFCWACWACRRYQKTVTDTENLEISK